MNEDILYQQYLSNNTESPISIEEFTSLKSIMSPEDFDNFVGLKKKENSQETPSSSSGLGENQPTPIYAQGNPQITSVPISQDLDLNQSQIEAMQGVQNPASLNLELPQQSVNQNGLLESNGEVNTSSSVLEDSFNNFIQEGGQLPLNPTSTRLNVLPRAYEEQFNNVTQATPQEEVGNVSLPKKSRVNVATFETNGLQEIPIPNKSISDELGNVVAKINNDVIKAYKTPSGQTILQTGVGLIPEEVYLSLKDKEGKQRTPQSKDVYENINGVFVEQDYSEVPIDETIKSYKNYDYISSKNFGGKDMAGNPITKEQEKNLYLGLQSKGLGTLEFHEDGAPRFKINKDTAYILDSMFLSDINDGISTRNAIRNSAYISSVYEGAELEKNARENFIARYGKANYDKYGVLPPQVMDRLQYEERVQNYVSQGYTEQEAVQYANTYRERELQGVREENNFILNNIFSKLKSEDSQEKKAWSTFAENYPKEFRDFFNEYTEKFGDEAWDNSYLLKRFDNPMRRASIKDEFINYLKTLQVYSQIELKNKEKQAKADVRFGAENKNADLINQGYAKLNNLNMVSKFIQGENNAIATLEDQTKPLFKQAYEKGIENAELESSANRDEFLGVLELGAKKIGNIPSRIIGNLFQSATSFFTGNSDWSKYVNEDIEFSKNAFELNKNAEELRTEVVTYKDKQGNIYKLRDGNIYKVDKNGYEFYKPELDNNSFKANLTEVSRDKEWNFTSVTAQGAQLIAEVYLMNRLGTSSGKLMSKPFGSYAVRIAKELGTESRYYNILKSAYKGIRASENASPFGMAAYTFGGMTKRNNDLGYDGLESWFKGIFDSGMMYAANRFFPDARFFKEGDKVQKTAFNLLKNGDKKGALELTKNFFIDASYYAKTSAPDIGYEMFEEMGLERMFQGVSDVVSGAFKQDKKIWEKAIDPNNFVDLSPETALLTALSTGTIKGTQNLKTSPLASFEGMTDLEKVILSTNMEGLPDALRFISSDASFAGFTGSKATRRLLEMQTAKKYLDQLPKDNTLTLSQTADVITNLQKLENLKKEQEKATSESVKKQYQEQINSIEEAIAKKFEESKNNTIVDEQPQQTTQPEQTQETAQGQTTETSVQSQQGTATTEQSISADVEAKKADVERRRQEELNNLGAKQKERYFLQLRDEKDENGKVTKVRTPEEKLNAINLIERNISEGSILTEKEQKELQKIKDELTSQGYEVPKILGKQFHQGMKVIVTSSTPDESLADGEEIITKVLTPQINKDDKMVQTAQIEVTVGTKKGGLTKEQWLEEQNKKEKRADKINAKYDAELKELENKNKTLPTNETEQTTVATEQGVSIDLNAKTGDTLYKQTDNTNQQNTQPKETYQTQEVEPIGKLGDGSNIYVDTQTNEIGQTTQPIENKKVISANLDNYNEQISTTKNNIENTKNEIAQLETEIKNETTNNIVKEFGSKIDKNEINSEIKIINEKLSFLENKEKYDAEINKNEILRQEALNELDNKYKGNFIKLNYKKEKQKINERFDLVKNELNNELNTKNELFNTEPEFFETKVSLEKRLSELEGNSNKENSLTLQELKKQKENKEKYLSTLEEDLKLIEKNKSKENNTQSPEIIGNQTVETAISEEEQVKINLERLNAYIEAKKQREQEQQAQVSPSAEMGNVQQNKAFSANEQPQTIEQPSETQTTPLVSESKSTNGKYTIRVEQNNGIGTAKILDNNGNEVKLTNKQKEKYVAEHFAKQSYPETVVEDADKLNPRELNQELVKTSNNPIELAHILDTESEFIPSDLLDAKENAIANVIGNKVSRNSFIQFDDANNITFSIARGYGLTNKGKTIDIIAQEAEVLIYGDWDSQNPRVTTEDVVKFMKKYNNGADTFFRQPNPIYIDAAGKLEKITGIKATKNALDVLLGKKTATKIDFAKLQQEADLLSAEQAYNLEKEYNEWFNSLSLEDKNLELQKTYPYEQRTEENTNQSQNESVSNNQTESSKNVANQERDGATTEEINQVSHSPQYEGAVTYTQFGEGQEGTIYYDEGVAKIKDKAGKVYNANSPLVKNLKDVDGNTIQLQKSNERLTTITKQAFDALVTKLQKAFPRFAKVTYDFEAFKKQAEKLGATLNDIQRMVMAFHGSPHSFDKFTTDKIGTGEGAQAFGWGLYFTDLESIAREYANKLTEPSFYVNGILQGENFKNNYPDLYNVGIELFGAKSKEDAINKVTNSAILSEKEKRRAIEVLSGIDSFKSEKNNRNLYKVTLHKGKTPSEYTWLEWDKQLSESNKNKIIAQGKKEGFNTSALFGFNNSIYSRTVYDNIAFELFNDDKKEASLFLLRAGIDGIKYPAESLSRGATSDTARGFNYVVFDENAVTIEDKIQFMQTPNGTIYGAKLPDGTIYLNPKFLNANTPIHEFSHLFEQLLPSRFKKGVELLKQTNLGKKLFEQLKQEGNYANLTDEQLWSEALNTHIGNFGENEVNNTKGKLKQLQDWIKDFFAKVGDVLGIKKLSPDTQLRMFTEGVVKDLLGGKPIVAESQVSPSEQVQYSFLTENDYDTNGNIKPEVLAEIQAERESIKAEAQANGTFMKAPNGKATNLNEAQWIDVRTKRFKDWFGDWENDAKNASKVIDENGEPMVVYHGTKDNFNEFDLDKVGKNGLALGKAFYFTNSPEIANSFGDVKSFYLKLNGEISNKIKTISKADVIKIITELEKYEEYFLSNYGDVQTEGRKSVLDNAIDDIYNYSDNDIDIINSIFNVGGVDREIVSKTIFDVTGKNGIIVNADITAMNATENEIVYAVITPNQIKSATSNIGTYSASSNDIRYSINSKTPLSVKEQTEIINDLVANGEESAFAKLQETNWYKGLSDSQKQNINTSNIAETVVNAVNSTKKNLEQKVERRDAKIEKLQQEKDKVVKSLKDKIKELKSEYKDKIAELNESNKSFKEKFAEKVFWKRQAVNAIKLILKDKYIRKNVTDNDIIKLLNLSDRIFRDKDVNVAFENFEKYLDKVMSKEDAKEKRDKEKYDKIYNEVEEQFNNGVSLSEIVKSYEKDTDKERAKKAYYEIQGKSVTPEQAVEMMDKINKAEEEMLNHKKSFKDRLKTIRQGFNQKLLDRQWLPKQLLEMAGAMDTFNRLINFGGASSKAKMLFDRAYRKIWFGLGIEDIKILNNIIQNKRVISIAENRAKRGLDPINNTVSEITINAKGKNIVVKQMMTKDTAQAYLDGVKAKIGEKKFNKLSQRAEAYFAEFKNLLDALLDNGMIRQEAYDSMVEIDYQPRVFLEHLLDYDQKLSKEEQEFRNKTNGLTKDLIKQLENGSEGALLSNSQLLLASAINSRVQAIAMNDINKQFITKDFPKAKIKFEAIDPKNFKNAEERRFYRYFKELDAKVIIPEGNTIDAKQGYSKAYYFENGVRKEFLLEDELHKLWHDKVRGLNPDLKQKLSYATGSSLLKGMATGYNPAFIIVNTPRDFLHTLSFSPEYRGVVLWEGALLATDLVRATGSIYKFNKGKDNIVRKYFEYGGGMDFLNQQGIAERDNVIRGTYQRLLKYLPQVVQDEMSADAVGKFLNTIALRPLSNYSELGFRIANFTRALENQLSDYNKDNKTKYKSIDEIPDKEIVNNIYHYAVSSTRGLLDFNQGGTFVKDADSVLPYINAGVQGTRAAVQAFRKDPIGVSTQIAQIVTMTSVISFGIGLLLMGEIRPDDEDEDKETLINNYLDFRESLTPEQKKNYFALPVGYNKVDNSYEVLLVAKSQPLTPLFILSEEVSENILKRQVGKQEKSMDDIIASMGRAFSDNIDPTSLSTLFTGKGRTFADNVKTTAGKLASRNPFFKGVATALTGYDFYFNQPLQDTQSGKLSKFEGQSSNKVEQFYKDFGLASDFSPVRTKAFIESIVTSPTTNPYVGMFYAGSDAIFTDVTAKEAIRDFLGYNKQKDKWMFREMPAINRAIKETSDFSRQLNQAENIKADDEYVKALEETEYMRMKSDEIISEYLDKARNAQYQDEADDFVKQGLEEALIYAKDKYKDDPVRGKQFMDRAITKLQNYDTDGRVWDIKYSAENNPEAQAFLIYSYFGNIEQNEDSERIIRSLKAAGLTSNSVMSYYQKIIDKNNK